MTGQYSYGTCKGEVKNEDESVQCDLCDKWNHIFCVDISSVKYEKLRLSAQAQTWQQYPIHGCMVYRDTKQPQEKDTS